MAFAAACVLDAVGLDQSAVDRSLLVGVGGRQVREEVRPVGQSLAVEPGIELVHDLLPSVQALGVYPGLQAGIPGLAGLAPFRLPPVQPAQVIFRRGQPGDWQARWSAADRSRGLARALRRSPPQPGLGCFRPGSAHGRRERLDAGTADAAAVGRRDLDRGADRCAGRLSRTLSRAPIAQVSGDQ
jgi:hypothetical protein